MALSNFEAGAAVGTRGATLEAAVVVPIEVVDFCELSSIAAAGGDETVETVVEAGLAALAGEEKKEVMEALALGFLAVEVAMSAALRLSGVAMMEVKAGAQSIASEEWWQIHEAKSAAAVFKGNVKTLARFPSATELSVPSYIVEN